MFFMRIISVKKNHGNIFRFVSILFIGDYKYNYFSVWKGVMWMLCGWVKICEDCMYTFLKNLKSQVKMHQVTLKHTTH